MAAVSADDARARFKAALAEKNFASRCHRLAALGRELREPDPASLEALLDGLTDDPVASCPAFDARARLVVAKAAGCLGYSRRFLGHPSHAVRFEAVHGGLLRAEDAREVFLSSNSSRSLKKMLVGCKVLPGDSESLEHAWQLFGSGDKALVWELLARVTDESLLRSWLLKGKREDMTEWVGSLMNERPCRSPPGLPQLARRFPQTMVDLVKQGTLKWGWYWTKDILSADPALVLRSAFLDGHRRGCGPKRAYDPAENHQSIAETLASWGWRHKPELMLDICRECAEREHRDAPADAVFAFQVAEIAEWLMEVSSTRYYISTGQKLQHLMKVWSLLPAAQMTAHAAQKFVSFLPEGLKAHRTKDLDQLVNTFWRIVSDLGRAPRKEILVGKDGTFLRCFLKKLPVPLAVDNFFRILEEFEADSPTYRFVQSDICKSNDGCHDKLILRVFERYLQRDGLSASQASSMFQVLLKDVRLMDVLQGSFDSLLRRLDNKMEIGLLENTVHRMQQLEKQSRPGPGEGSEACLPKATLPVPVGWARLVELPGDRPPHVDFLFHVLNTDRDSKGELLGAMLGKYGPSFFWDTMGHVLKAARRGELLEAASAPPDMVLLKKLNISAVLQPLQRANSTRLQPGEPGEPASRYFSVVADVKKKTIGKDVAQRCTGYSELITIAYNERNQSRRKALEDLFPFLVGRFSGEQDTVRLSILQDVLRKECFGVWEEMLPHLIQLWKICSKSRESASYTGVWRDAGVLLVEKALTDWTDGAEPSAACTFGMDVMVGLNLPSTFVKLHKERKDGKALSDSAARWVFETAVPLTSDTDIPISTFWKTLKKMAEIVPRDKGAERALWERWPFVSERWRALLAPGLSQKAVNFALVGVVDVLTERSKELAKRDKTGKIEQLWWAPLECSEYKEAVDDILAQMESGEIPAKEASTILTSRVESVMKKEQKTNSNWKVRGRKRRERSEMTGIQMHAKSWVSNQTWDIPKHKRYEPLPWETYRCTDAVAVAEVRTLSKILASGKSLRQVLWNVVEVAALLSGAEVSRLVGEAIATLDARFEGMARCIGRHYPYLNAALTKGETQAGSSDVLTPLLELWLFDDGPRDACVGSLMERGDCEYFLFFGCSFARHLSNVRQEWLHRCLGKLRAPGAESFEFYHYARRGPMLHQVAQLGSSCPGWRGTLAGKSPLKTQARPVLNLRRPRKGRRGRTMDPPAVHHVGVAGSVQVHLWHADTQAEFMEKALLSTDKEVLALMPRFEYAKSIAHLDKVLKQYPKEQTVKQRGTDIWGWEVIQAAGAYSDLKAEIERRFSELPAPWVCDVVADPEVETLLAALGRADNALEGLGVLHRYAGKVKRVVKESVTKLITQVSPERARGYISDTMLSRKSGVGLQVAGLRKIAELQIPHPLELYRKAWSNGKCPRDVAGIILAKVNTAQSSFSPADVRGFFDFFSQMAGQQDECIYVAGLLLDQLIESPSWSLPFLPEVVANLAMLPGMAAKAVAALQSCTSHVSEVFGALTEILKAARIAARVQPSVAQDSPEAQTLKDLAALTSLDRLSILTNGLSRLHLEKCEPPALLSFVGQLLSRWQDAHERDGHKDNLLRGTLAIWVKLLHAGEMESWPGVLATMETRLARQVTNAKTASNKRTAGNHWAQDLRELAQAVAGHVSGMSMGPEDRASALAIASGFFQGLLDKRLCADSSWSKDQADSVFRAEVSEQEKVADGIITKCWAELLAHGCPEAESARLFSRCPDRLRVQVARQIVDVAVKDAKEKRASRAQWRQKRPEQGWKREIGIPVEDVQVGSKVDGIVTNSSAMHGVFFNFGCVKDGKLNVPAADWKKYHVGDEVRGMIVNSVDIKQNNQFIELILVGEVGDGPGDAFPARDVARRAVAWLGSPAELRGQHFSTLAELWASVVALEADGSSFEEALGLLGLPPPPPGGCVRAVVELLGREPARSVARHALAWLGQVSPEDAVQLWPSLLAPPVGQQDVEALLALCEAQGLELPVLPKLVARDLSEQVLGVLAASRLPEARLLVVQALSERHCSFSDLPPVLEALCKDPCEVVKVAARNLWMGLKNSAETASKEANKEEEEEDDDEDDDDDDDDDDEDSEGSEEDIDDGD